MDFEKCYKIIKILLTNLCWCNDVHYCNNYEKILNPNNDENVILL